MNRVRVTIEFTAEGEAERGNESTVKVDTLDGCQMQMSKAQCCALFPAELEIVAAIVAMLRANKKYPPRKGAKV